jgi:hypothetical protein
MRTSRLDPAWLFFGCLFKCCYVPHNYRTLGPSNTPQLNREAHPRNDIMLLPSRATGLLEFKWTVWPSLYLISDMHPRLAADCIE